MNLSRLFIERPVMTSLVFVAIILLGLLSYEKLAVSDLPDVDFPVITVKVEYPGATPETMANAVALPLEKEFMTIGGIKEVTSSNKTGLTNIILQFDISKSIDAAAVDVQAAIMRAKSDLPPDLPHDPTYLKINPAVVPFLYIVVSSDTMSLADLYTYANTYIGQRLAMINGVAQVDVHGFPYAVRVRVDPEKIANLGITLDDVAKTIKEANVNLPTGEFVGSHFSTTLKVKGQLASAKLYDPLIITYKDQSPLRIQDIGKAMDSLKRYRHEMIYIKGNKRVLSSIVISLQKQIGSNTVRVSDRIRAYLPKITLELPAAVNLTIMFDKSEAIKESVAEAQMTLILAFILVTLVVFFYLGKVRDTIIPSIILPMSVLGTFLFMYLMNYSIDNLSILAFILAMGFIIDDAIVVLENIVRRTERGETPRQASIEGSKQIGFTILSMTLSLVAVFIPIIFMGGLIGNIFREFAVVLAAITIISGIISLTLTPMLCSLFITTSHQEKKGWIEQFSYRMNNGMLNLYKLTLNWVLDHRWIALLVSALTVLLSGYIFILLPKDFIANDDIGFVIVYLQGQEGISPTSMIKHQNVINDILAKDPNIEEFVSLAAYPNYRNGVAYLRLKPRHERKSIEQVNQDLIDKLKYVPGINSFVKNIPSIDFSLGQESKGNYQYTLQSLDSKLLYTNTEKFINKMYTLPGFQGISSDLEIRSPQITLNILRDRASSLGVSAETIERTFKLAFSGEKLSRIETEIDHYNVILELLPFFQKNSSTLSSIYVRSDTTKELVPLSEVAEWVESVGPASISHIAQFPSTTIFFNIKPGFPAGEAISSLNLAAAEVLPHGITGAIKGTAQAFAESFENILILFMLAILTIYIVLGILYESFIHPLTILTTLPPAIFGGLLTLAVLGLPFSFYAALGIFMLIGIVKKNGIMMIDCALDLLRTRNLEPREAITEACLLRFRPIMMTTMAAIMGAIPIILATGMGAEARHPLGFVIIGGLLFSQLITLFVTPAIYIYMERWNKH